MRTKLTLLAIGTVLLLAPVPMWAHHAFAAEFDAKRPVKLRGTVTKFEMINPHSWIHIEVKGADGKVTEWMIEGGSPNALFRRGININTVPVGTELLVDGYQAKDGANRAVGSDLTLADGKRLFMGSSSPDSPDNKRAK
jgi:hypothetical protein